MRRTARIALALLALIAWAALGGCERRSRYTPLGADSTASRSADSLDLDIRRAQEAWDVPGGAGDGAALTAQLVRDDLRRHPDIPPDQRARRFLDSLLVGAEIESDGIFTVINLFARADPDAGSWPFLYWGEGEGLQMQPLEGQGLRLTDIAARGENQTAVLYLKRAPAGMQPMLMMWMAGKKGGWNLTTTLGPDSLGGVGDGHFEAGPGDAVDLVTRTWRTTTRFDECAACPHVVYERRFRWDDAGFRRIEERLNETPYTAFVAFVGALSNLDRWEAERWVADPSLVDSADALGWGLRGAPWRVAPGTPDRTREITFYRGPSETYLATFQPRSRGWVITGITRTSRKID